MSDQLDPQKGAYPWLPATNVESVEVLNEYDFPLMGLVEQEGRTYLYACLFGEVEDLNIWAYARLDDGEVKRLQSVFNEDLMAAIEHALKGKMLVVALAVDYRLDEWESVDTGVESTLRVTRRFLRKLRSRLEASEGRVDKLEHEPELVDAY